jgi:AraC family transcriptional regulator
MTAQQRRIEAEGSTRLEPNRGPAVAASTTANAGPPARVHAHWGSAAGALARPLPGSHVPLELTPCDCARVNHYIEERLGCDIGLGDLAGLLHCSRQHFARRFKATYAMSPYQYVIERRVERAKALLRHSGLPLSEVAGACGFGDQSHFTTCFSCRVGISPRRYRDGAEPADGGWPACGGPEAPCAS